MDTVAIGKLFETLGFPLGLIVLLISAVVYMFLHIINHTVASEIYNKTCETQKTMEAAIGDNTKAVHELALAHTTTNQYIKTLAGQGEQ